MAVSLASVKLMGSLRMDVLRMYRKILRLGRTWDSKTAEETPGERQYIRDEARRCFRENQDLSSDVDVKKKLDEAKSRVEIAQHYGIAYKRPVYYGTGSFTRLNKKNIQQQQEPNKKKFF